MPVTKLCSDDCRKPYPSTRTGLEQLTLSMVCEMAMSLVTVCRKKRCHMTPSCMSCEVVAYHCLAGNSSCRNANGASSDQAHSRLSMEPTRDRQPDLCFGIFRRPLHPMRPLCASADTSDARRKLSSGMHRVATSTDHKVPDQVCQHAGAATWQPQSQPCELHASAEKDKCSTTSTCLQVHVVEHLQLRLCRSGSCCTWPSPTSSDYSRVGWCCPPGRCHYRGAAGAGCCRGRSAPEGP